MLRIAKNLELPDEAITQTFAILAKRGVGKTYTASVMVEEMLKNNLPVVVLDPIGVWWGLRSSADGKSAGLQITIAGGDHADVPIEPSSGEVLANLIVDEKIPMVIDLSLFRKGEQIRFVTDFAETLYHRNRSALHVVVDEADAFAPQQSRPNTARMLGAMEDLVRRGRARGIGLTLITQRPAVLNKNVLTQVEVLVALRLIAPQDRKAVDEWIMIHAEKDQRDEFMQSLPQLKIGEAWFWSPGWLDIFTRVQVRKRETLDSSSTPKAGALKVEARKMADVDLNKIRDQLKSTIEKVEAEDPKALQRKVIQLQRELDKKQPEVKVEKVEVQVITDEQIQALTSATLQMQQASEDIIHAIRAANLRHTPPAGYPKPKLRVNLNAEEHEAAVKKIKPNTPVILPADHDVQILDEKLSLAERKILSALAQYPNGRSMNQVAMLAGYAVNGGGFRNALSSLRSKGFIEGRGDIQITDAGLAAIGNDYETLPQGQALIDYWKNNSKLGRAERMILEVAVDFYPAEVTIDELAERTGYAANGGGFRNALSRLRTLELIEGRGEIKAHDALFQGVTA